MKRPLFLLLAFVFIEVLLISCCPDPITYFNQITGIRAVNIDLYDEIVDGASVSQSTFRIKCEIDEEIIGQHFRPSLLINNSYATSCEDNWEGLKTDIIKFEITSNKEVWNIPPGNPLNIQDRIVVYKRGFNDDSKNSRKTIQEWLNILNNGGYQLAFEWYFEFKERIDTNEAMKFKLTFELENGQKFEAETSSVVLN